MQRYMLRRALSALLGGLGLAIAGCGGGGYSGTSPPPPQPMSASMPLVISDASSDDWATIGVRLMSIALVPQGGGTAVTVWTAATPAPFVNLEQLDQLGEILGNVSVPEGTYSGAVLTISANPGDVALTVAADPESGFPAAAGTTIPSAQIQIPGAQGAAGSLTVPVKVTFDTPLTVSASQSNALNLEFDLAHPAFLVDHSPPTAVGVTLWAINFDGPVRRRPVYDLTRLILRHTYGTVSSVDTSTPPAFFTITKNYPVWPASNPETAITGKESLNIYADATNGTIFYDVDAKTRTVLKDFSSLASTLSGKFVRVAARYQVDGKLVGVRVWASTSFANVWLSPEGHVLHVNTTTNIITVANEFGRGIPVSVGANTEFFFRTPENALADVTPIGTGPAFLASHNLVRGFKVHVSGVDPTSAALVADTIDIETAAYSGRISAANPTNFTYTHQFFTATDDYSLTLPYIDKGTANGTDATGNPIAGFKWWDFTFPTLINSGPTAVAQFVTATNGGVNFGGSVGTLTAWGVSGATWADLANPTGWSLRDAVLIPTPVPIGTVTTAFAGTTFAMTVLGGTLPVTVDVDTTAQSATLVYQIDRSGGIITITPIDVSTSAGQATITAALKAGTIVKVYGVPQADTTLKAYVLAYFTGVLPAG